MQHNEKTFFQIILYVAYTKHFPLSCLAKTLSW